MAEGNTWYEDRYGAGGDVSPYLSQAQQDKFLNDSSVMYRNIVKVYQTGQITRGRYDELMKDLRKDLAVYGFKLSDLPK